MMEFNGKVITVSGSTRFEKTIDEVEKDLVKKGYCILSFPIFKNYEWPKPSIEVLQFKKLLRDVHFKRLDLSDGMYVVDVNGYIGESTREEIQYATEKGIPITYYSQSHNENK